MTSILNPNFRYIPPANTDITETWRKHGWQPTTPEQREARQRAHAAKQYGPTTQRSKSAKVVGLPKRSRSSGSE